MLCTRDGNTKHENLVFRVSCISIQTRNPKSKHETNTIKVETRNKHEKLENLHVLLDCLSTIIFPLSSRLSLIHIETLMLVSSNSISFYLFMWLYTRFSQTEFILYNQFLFAFIKFSISETRNTKKTRNFKIQYKHESIKSRLYIHDAKLIQTRETRKHEIL